MGTLVRMRTNIFTITNQPNFRHQNPIRLHYWRKIEIFMENLKIRKYPFFTFFDRKIIKIIANDINMELFWKILIKIIKYVYCWPCQTMLCSKKLIFRYFLPIFLRGRATIWLNSVFLKGHFDGNIVQNKKLYIHN